VVNNLVKDSVALVKELLLKSEFLELLGREIEKV
jgi:hypothetical protein